MVVFWRKYLFKKKNIFTKNVSLANNFIDEKMANYYFNDILFIPFRYEISNHAAAALANGLMKDLGLIAEGDTVNVFDSRKIQR